VSATIAVPSVAFGPSAGRSALIMSGGILFVLAAAVAAVTIGSSDIGIGDAAAIVLHRLTGIGPVTWPAASETIVWELRLPRVLTGIVVGAGLACAGTVFQALLRNPLADPYLIGPAAGASFGAVLALLLPVAAVGWLGIGLVQSFAFVGGLLTVLLVLAIARGRPGWRS
jgi:iron complex transport system permease protein